MVKIKEKLARINKRIVFLSLSTAVAAVLVFASADAWVEPSQPAPGGNVGAPINTSGIGQRKSGSLSLGDSLGVDGLARFYGNARVDGTFNANGAANLNDAARVGGDFVANGPSRFNDTATFNRPVLARGALGVEGLGRFYGNARVEENLTVNGAANLNGQAKVEGNFTANSPAQFNDTVSATGTILSHKDIQARGDVCAFVNDSDKKICLSGIGGNEVPKGTMAGYCRIEAPKGAGEQIRATSVVSPAVATGTYKDNCGCESGYRPVLTGSVVTGGCFSVSECAIDYLYSCLSI